MRKRLPGLARLATATTLGLTSAGALTGALVLATAGSASAATLSGTIPYTCPITVGGSVLTTPTLNIGVSATAPASVAPGGSITLTDLQTSTTIPASLVTELVDLLHVTSFGGTVITFDFNATGATPGTINGVPAAGIAFSVKVTTGHSATIVLPSTPETVGPWTAGSSGTVSIEPGNVTITSKVGTSSATISCTTTASSIPSSEIATVAIASSTGTTVASTPTTVPVTHTGEPWAGWPYWAIVGLAGIVGLGSLDRAVRIRRRRV
jgi:hypothetical protein